MGEVKQILLNIQAIITLFGFDKKFSSAPPMYEVKSCKMSLKRKILRIHNPIANKPTRQIP